MEVREDAPPCDLEAALGDASDTRFFVAFAALAVQIRWTHLTSDAPALLVGITIAIPQIRRIAIECAAVLTNRRIRTLQTLTLA